MKEINLCLDKENPLAKKIFRMLEARGYEPEVTENFIQHGSKYSSLLLVGLVTNKVFFSDVCLKGNSKEIDCNYIPCQAHKRKIQVAITEKQVYEVWDADSEMEIRNKLIDENNIPVLEKVKEI